MLKVFPKQGASRGHVFVAGTLAFNGEVNERLKRPEMLGKWATSQYWQEVTACSCQRLLYVGVDGGCLKLLEQGPPFVAFVGISILSLRLICIRSEPKPSRLFSPF